MKNFKALADRISKVDPTTIDSDQYKPSNVPQTCPPVSDVWEVSGDNLPITPDQKVCDCMFAGLSCKASPTLDEKNYGDIFNFVCGTKGRPCDAINGNATSGKYGVFSMCNAQQKLGYVLDRYYKNQNNAADACDFSGQATLVTPTKTDAECEQKLTEASQAASAANGDSGNNKTEDDSSAVRFAAAGLYVAVAFVFGTMMVL